MRKSALKGSLALLLGLTSAAALPIGAQAAESSADFADLQDADAATKAKLDALISAGVFNGVSEDTFGLDQPLTRAQLAKVITLTMGLNVDSQVAASSFTDVDGDEGDHWALGYIEAVRNAGIMEGMGDGKFGPSIDVTKEQLAAVLVRALGIDVQSEQEVRDESVSAWAGAYVAAAVNHGLIPNDPDGTFGGSETATRDLVVAGSYETAQTLEASKPLAVSGADFAEGNTLELTLTAAIDGSSVDLGSITINGVPLDPKLDSFTLSADKKTIIVKLHQGFTIDTSKTPEIVVSGLKTVFGNEVKPPSETSPIPVTVTAPPAGSTSSVVTPPSVPSAPSVPTPPPSSGVSVSINPNGILIDAHLASFQITSNGADTIYYVIRSGAAVSLNAGEVADPSNPSDYALVGSGSPDSLASNGFSADYLEANSQYTLYVVGKSGSAFSPVVTYSFTTLEEPVLQAPSTPMIDQIHSGRVHGEGGDTVQVSLNSSRAATVYYVLLAADAGELTADEIKYGWEGNGWPVDQSGTFRLSGDGSFTLTVDHLSAADNYYLYAVGSNEAGDSGALKYMFIPVSSDNGQASSEESGE